MTRPLPKSLAAFALAPLFAYSATRVDVWRYSEVSAEAAVAGETVAIPHTWNATDIQAGRGRDDMGRDGYRRAPSWYATQLPTPTPGKRVFVRFGAVSSVAEVSLNGHKLGTHRGPATAFAFELTPHLSPGGANTLLVKADNTWRSDVAPLSGDFGIPGGIYRAVELLEKPPVCISPLVLGSRGVSVTTLRADKTRAELKVVAHLDRAANAAAEVAFRLLDAKGAPVATAAASAPAGVGATSVEVKLSLDSPHLWNGLKDPYLYTLETSLAATDGSKDTQKLKVGLRTLTFDKDKGAFLNGEAYPLRGVNRHQDREGRAWAVTEEQEREDAALIREIGANAVRAAHYPHSEVFLDECDRLGLLVWAEAPLIDTVGQNPAELGANAELQLREMMAQQRHHACVFCWSLFNEIGQREGGGKNPLSVVRRLNDVAHAVDPSRPTAGATNRAWKELNSIADLMAYNGYPGWYGGGKGGHDAVFKSFRASAPDRPWGISEYGAGASLSHQDDSVMKGPKPAGKWHPEAWQSRVHEHALASIERMPQAWGTFVWNMADFASPWRTEGERDGINAKGLVTYDRRTRKDAFFLYKANWSDAPVLHLLARRDSARKSADTVVRYYSNLADVRVTLNGAALPAGVAYAPSAYIIGNVRLRPGKNTVEAAARTKDGKSVTDAVEWVLEGPAKQPAPRPSAR